MEPKFTADLIAPCGMNCGVCKSYLAFSREIPHKKGKVTHCSGCISRDKNCAFIKRDCPNKLGKELRFCYECKDMPCAHLTKLDQLYSTRYSTSLIGNLNEIKANGMPNFLGNQAEKHSCPKCEDIISVHDGKCYACGYQEVTPQKRMGKATWNKARWVPNKNKAAQT